MNVILFGYRKWSYNIFRGLLKSKKPPYKIASVFTIDQPEADYSSLPADVHIIDPKDLLDNKTTSLLKKLKPDAFLFYGWSWMIPKEIYENFTCLILHTSPLPKYRGGSPLQHQIINGEKISAVSIFQATEGVDEGPMYAQAPFSLQGTLNEILTRITKVGLRETKQVLEGLAIKKITPKPQDESKKTVYKRRKPSESELTLKDFRTKSAEDLYNFIRALADPYPNAYIVCKDGKRLYFTGAKVDEHNPD